MDSFFSLPFKPGTRILTLNTLDQHSKFRKPERGYMPIHDREISFANELLTVGVKIYDEPEEKVYIKVTEHALLVSCSVDTDESYLSRYAYFALTEMMDSMKQCNFDQWFWPGCFDPATGKSKFLSIARMGKIVFCRLKLAYRGLVKPGHTFPILSDEDAIPRSASAVIHERIPADGDPIVGFSLAYRDLGKRYDEHVPFVVPYLGIANKAKTVIKGFHKYISSEEDLFLPDLSDEQRQLIDICLDMRQQSRVRYISSYDNIGEIEEKRQYNSQILKYVFALWQQAMPLLAGRLFTHYQYSYGMRRLKGKPYRDRLSKCVFRNESPELCFVWKDFGDHYKLELRFKIDKQIWMPSYEFNVIFLANTQKNPRTFYLLRSYMDSVLVSYFHEDKFQLVILKEHYEGRVQEFVEGLRSRYKFVER